MITTKLTQKVKQIKSNYLDLSDRHIEHKVGHLVQLKVREDLVVDHLAPMGRLVERLLQLEVGVHKLVKQVHKQRPTLVLLGRRAKFGNNQVLVEHFRWNR